MEAYLGGDVWLRAFLTFSLVEGEWSASRPGRFTPRESALGTHRIGGWVGPRGGLDTVVWEKFPARAGIRTPYHAARSPALFTNCIIATESCPCALTEHHSMEAYWGIGGIAPLIFDLGIRGEWSASRTGHFSPREGAPGTH
jgi:hypothetical protein